MKVHKVRIDGQMFILDPEFDVVDVKRQIVTAAREGADFVDFYTVGRDCISVLITGNLPVRFEVIEQSADQIAEWEHHPPTIDVGLDEHLEFYEEPVVS